MGANLRLKKREPKKQAIFQASLQKLKTEDFEQFQSSSVTKFHSSRISNSNRRHFSSRWKISKATMFSGKKRKDDPELFKSEQKTKRSSSMDLNLEVDDEFDLSKFISFTISSIYFVCWCWFFFSLLNNLAMKILRLCRWIRSDLKGLMSALQQIKAKAQLDGQKKNEETISRWDSVRFGSFQLLSD